MDPEALKLFAEVFLEVTTFVILLFGLFGLLIPVFPGLTVMWIATLVYAIVRLSVGNMTWVGWLLFVVITLLMVGGNIADNIIIAKHVRDKNVPWSSIIWAFAAGIVVSLFLTPLAGIIASPIGLYLAEWYRLKEKQPAFDNTKAWMTGWGWSLAARFGIGVVMIAFWGLWAWI
ncbi:MAG TPA: DUF456 domain-containing protein [Anaerolineales bacterium]|nr:DUF456 domain-containing protein [Anaerolineales bacterium]HMV95005.1 DUF456 domain-containing protein [Anaerolineales bacterium]HMX19953.1 DUF456 domain-containing protein [Anaerolineales bacterium]HMX72981.1 DUF456 domain-containing protein [Anaerolineales bacterium]HMZ42473.1 DUF456 domain-containing protein [Anaerolineales bacterium]